MAGKEGTRQSPFRAEKVRGEPIWIGERKLIPVARVVSFGSARGTIGTGRISGWGSGFAQVTPVAMVESTAEGERRIAISNTTSMVLAGFLAAAVVITLGFTAIRWLARRLRRTGS